MKKLPKLIVALLFIPLLVQATTIKRYKYEKIKKIKREFNVNADALLKINNRYGNVDVISWDGDRIIIEVTITVKGNDEDKVVRRLETIDVNFDASSSFVSAKTIIEKRSSTWSWSWGRKSNVNYQIDYKVKVPITNNVNLMNDYGNISLNELKGDASINCDYGNINAGDLLSANNKINLDYGNANIAFIKGGTVNVDYSKFTIEEANTIHLNADYTTSVFEKIKSLDYTCDYGSLKVSNGVVIVGNGDYLTTRLGTISKKVDITSDYGSIRIENLKEGFDSVDINGDYCGIKIGVPDAPFNFIIKLSYGSFKRDQENFEYIKQIIKSSSKYYEGYFKAQQAGATIKIDSDYGSVTFY
ncbi:MAG TPA: hypothetical protein ENK46_11675 [Flavobacteriia bacterium]|jgi:hypothetical protein|nr:hypothetical protein [Flavobacteriia bacterium]